jgi:hypothetical protein
MPTTTFLGEVQGGRILTEQPLAEFEGHKVSVTVIPPETPVSGEASAARENPPPEPLVEPEESIILEDLGRIRLPRREVTTIRLEIVDVGRRPVPVYASDDEN